MSTRHPEQGPCAVDHPARWSRYTPLRPALHWRDQSWSWAELERRVQRTSRLLLDELGLQRGERVALLARNHPCFFELAYACLRSGLVLAPLNYRLAAQELSALLELCAASVLFVDQGSRPLVEGSVTMRVRSVEALERAPGLDEAGPQRSPRPLGLEEAALLLFTSGTTGRPKAAVLPVRQLFWNAVNTQLAFGLTGSDSTVLYTPLFHTGAINVLALPLLQCGGQVLVHEAFDAVAVLEALETRGISTIFGVPTTLQMLADQPAFDTLDLGALRLCLCGGAPLSVELIRRYQDRGLLLTQGFGMTEVGPNCFFLPPHEALARAGSVGLPMPYCEARVVVDCRDAQVDQVGELWLAGPQVCLGYHDDPQATAAAISGGWFRTGDLVRRDADGFFHVAGRKKDMFISGGENVYPAEVELALAAHPAVAECAVVAMPDERWGEVGCAFVVPGNGGLEPAELRGWLRQRLAHYKVPKAFLARRELPRNPSGKLLKPALVQEALRHAR